MTKKIINQIAPPPSQKLPLTVEMVKAISNRNSSTRSFTSIRNTCLIILEMASFCRESEMTNLLTDDVWLDTITTNNTTTTALFMYIEKTKVLRDRIGYTVIVPPGSSDNVCPVEWFRRYSRIRARSATHFFHSALSPYDRLDPATPNHIIKAELSAIGINPSLYGSHSCRSGGVSEAINQNNNIAIHLLKRHGNWKSDAIYNYVRDSWERQMKVKVF
jgi:hypothetical protein